jgi:nucleoside-diphosphate-sugar epimerase
MKIIVTGGSGRLGWHLIKQLLERRGYDMTKVAAMPGFRARHLFHDGTLQ